MQNEIAPLLILLVIMSVVSCSQTPSAGPRRGVRGHTIRSTDKPAVDLKFGKDFKYAGGQSFVLYNVATAEQHFYVDADKDGRVKRLYWIQFEGFLPNNSHVYEYEVTKLVNIGGFDFIADSWARNIKTDPGRPDGDGARARAFLESKGYKLASDEVISQRLVHMVSDKKRDELMIIYLEVSPPGSAAVDLNKGGKDEARWNDISAGLLDRAQKGMKIRKIE